MKTIQIIQNAYAHLIIPKAVSSIATNQEYVYGLIINNVTVICGRGKKQRAKVIFDDLINTTVHIKALTVRLHLIYGDPTETADRFLIPCKDKLSAEEIERDLHTKFGGAGANIPASIREELLKGLSVESQIWLAIQLALHSAYDGISDLRRWRKNGLLSDGVWNEIARRLRLAN